MCKFRKYINFKSYYTYILRNNYYNPSKKKQLFLDLRNNCYL